MARNWFDVDLGLDAIKDETVAVIGYGIQGHAQASNMKDAGLKVIVADVKGSSAWEKAVSDGHRVYETPDAVRQADIVHILIPDMLQGRAYEQEIGPNLSKGKALGFSHGAAIHWKWVNPPEWVDVIMIAPKGPGQRLRELYKEGFGIPALVAVYQDYTKNAWDRILAIGKATGCARAGLIETNFKEEVETDWFGEQVDLCGGTDQMIRCAFETLVENGYQPEVAYFECLHELKLIVDLIQKYGIAGMYRRVSETARHGGLTRGGRAIGEDAKKAMKEVLEEIRSGKYEKEWVQAYEKEGTKAFEKHLRALDDHPVEVVGRRLRKMMWPKEEVV